ncbi:uncharacterized protein [Antedon mediterranea]|uniref:uncharacterized protein isoform X2 n=1 Tax=Antedon mediterranea TaxID=105859 RepID=UPI003AF9BBBC
MNNLTYQEVLAENRILKNENDKLKRSSEGIHVISEALVESRKEGEKLKGTIRILTQQLSSVSSSESCSNSISIHTIDKHSSISDQTLLGLADKFGSNWRSLAFRLDIKTEDVDRVQEEYESAKEQIFQILLLWKQKQTPSSDVHAKLVSVLERTGRLDLAEMLQTGFFERNETTNYDLPWFVDAVSFECKNDWRELAEQFGLTSEQIAVNSKLPPAERIYGLFDIWLNDLKHGDNVIQLLATALKDIGREDVADKIIEASKLRPKYVEEWSMKHQETSTTLNPKPKSSECDTMSGIPSLKNSSIHSREPTGIQSIESNVTKQESVRSFGVQERMDSTSSMSEQEHDTSLSLQIKDIEKICRTQFGSSELTNGLAKMLPQSIQQDKQLKQLKTLRHATIEQNQRLKEDLEDKNQTINDLRLEARRLKNELEDLKKVKEDENLYSFEVVTTGDAHALRKEEKLDVETKQGTSSDNKPQDNLVIVNLRKENASLKKQVDEILKVNNEWDQHYAGMKSSYEAKLKKAEEVKQQFKQDLDQKLQESMQRMAVENKQESILDKKQREFDQMLTQAKTRIDAIELERDEHRDRSARLEKWVHMLISKKTENEEEISRLNQELEQSMQQPREFEIHRGAAAAAVGIDEMRIPRGADDDVSQRMKEQVDLLQQQNMAFQSDFNQERRDRQHTAGQLAEAKEELHNLRKIAKDLQEQVNYYEGDRRIKQPPPGYKSYYIHEVPPRGKMIRRGVNYGGNDMFIDGDVEIDGVDASSPVLKNADSECPMLMKRPVQFLIWGSQDSIVPDVF